MATISRTMAKKRKSKKIRYDHKGPYEKHVYFVNGKQKALKIRLNLIGGIPVDEFLRRNADPIFLMQIGEYQLLDGQQKN